MKNVPLSLLAGVGLISLAFAQSATAQTEPAKQTPQSTEIWEPVPPVITPGSASPAATGTTPPSDAVVLFDGKNTDEWVAIKGYSPANWEKVNEGPLKWPVQDGIITRLRVFGPF